MNSTSSPHGLRAKVCPAQLLTVFTRLLVQPLPQPWPLASVGRRRFYDRLWSPLITLWYLLWQRLQLDPTLDAVVKDARAGGADALCAPHKKLSVRLRSRATTSYSDARQRLPVRWLRQAFTHCTQQLRANVPGLDWHGLAVVLLDGSTLRVRPHGNLAQRFAPAANQHGPAYWCLLRVVVGFCASSGLAVATGLGPETVSEQALAVPLILRAAAAHLWIGDRNFGVWRIVRAAVQAQSHVLVRLTEVRARRLLGRALSDGLDVPVCWTPTRHNQADPGLERLPVNGRLVVMGLRRPGFRTLWLYLFTTLADATLAPVAQLVALYGVRWHVELNLRYLKAQMGLGQLEVKSARMAIKQWYAGLLAYNLIRGVMLWAAAAEKVAPLTLSFAQARRLVRETLRMWQRTAEPAGRRILWAQLLADVAATSPPRRQQPRPAEPRRKRAVPEPFPPLRGSRTAARRQLQEQLMKS
jgi:hypothetical protein